MKRSFLFFLILLSGLLSAQKQQLTGAEFYYGFSDYKKGNLSRPEVYAEIKSQNENYVKISSFRHIGSDDKAKKENRAWLMKYNDHLYFNMTYAAYIFSYDTFSKVDVISKKYILLYLDETKDKKAIAYNTAYPATGLMGVLMNTKPRFSWKDRQGNSYKVLLIDVDHSNNTADDRDISFGHILDTKAILKMTDNHPEVIAKLKSDRYYLEDIIELVKNENNK